MIGSTNGSTRRPLRALLVVTVIALSVPVWSEAATQPVSAKPDIVYTHRTEGPLALDLYRPTGSEPLPVLILVHGGSWRRGDKSDWDRAALRFARAGFLVVAPNYRLSPPGGATVFPGHVDDLRTALRWTRNNARDHGGLPRRIGMVGTSAGGHLSLLIAATGRARPNAVAVYSAPVELHEMHRGGVATQSIEAFLGCTPEECPDTYARASGLWQIDEATPPVFVAYSTEEVLPVEQGRMLAQRLAEVGVAHRVRELEGTEHGLNVARQVFDDTVRFLRRSLSGRV